MDTTPDNPARDNPAADNAGVIGIPPLTYLCTLVAGFLLQRFWPMPIFGQNVFRWLGAPLLLLGAATIILARNALAAAGTSINPTRPTTTIVSTGPYRFTRNPLYVSLTLIYCGLTLAANTWWSFILFPALALLMHFGVVRREERYLERKFGDAYRQYCSRVRRYF